MCGFRVKNQEGENDRVKSSEVFLAFLKNRITPSVYACEKSPFFTSSTKSVKSCVIVFLTIPPIVLRHRIVACRKTYSKEILQNR